MSLVDRDEQTVTQLEESGRDYGLVNGSNHVQRTLKTLVSLESDHRNPYCIMVFTSLCEASEID